MCVYKKYWFRRCSKPKIQFHQEYCDKASKNNYGHRQCPGHMGAPMEEVGHICNSCKTKLGMEKRKYIYKKSIDEGRRS